MENNNLSDNNEVFQPKKRLKKTFLTQECKKIILNMYNIEMQENPNELINDIYTKVASMTGVAVSSVYRIVREYKTTNTLSGPKPKRSKTCRNDVMDDADKNAIRRKIHAFFIRNEIPSLQLLLDEVNNDETLPNFKKTNFYKLTKILNFKFVRARKRNILSDTDDIMLWRRGYLTKIKTHRSEGRQIYYLDETSININTTSDSSKKSSDKGTKLMICHIGSTDGFVPEALWAFESKKSGDCNEEMDGKLFEEWFQNVLPQLSENAVIVMDNAPHHSRKLETIPTKETPKADIQAWLSAKNIQFHEDSLKVELLKLVKENKSKYDRFIVDELAKEYKKTVLRLPPYHRELNPIEMIWADVRNVVASRNASFSFCKDAVENINAEKWKECIKYVIDEVEPKMWELDNIIENLIEPLDLDKSEHSNSDFSD